jgi:hypothetical protein
VLQSVCTLGDVGNGVSRHARAAQASSSSRSEGRVVDAELRKLLRVDLLTLELCRPWNYADTADAYELIVERHCQATITTPNRQPMSCSA